MDYDRNVTAGVDMEIYRRIIPPTLCSGSSVGLEYLATNQVVGGSSPSGRAIYLVSYGCWIDLYI